MAEKRVYKVGTCGSCGQPMKIAASNQKRCALCTLGLQASWHDGRKAECPMCGKKYIAWSGGYRTCGSCFIARTADGARDSITATCGWHGTKEGCQSPNPESCIVFEKRLLLCYPCLQEPTKFKLNREAILDRMRQLTDGQN